MGGGKGEILGGKNVNLLRAVLPGVLKPPGGEGLNNLPKGPKIGIWGGCHNLNKSNKTEGPGARVEMARTKRHKSGELRGEEIVRGKKEVST